MLIGLGYEFMRNAVIIATTCQIDRKAKKREKTQEVANITEVFACKHDLPSQRTRVPHRFCWNVKVLLGNLSKKETKIRKQHCYPLWKTSTSGCITPTHHGLFFKLTYIKALLYSGYISISIETILSYGIHSNNLSLIITLKND